MITDLVQRKISKRRDRFNPAYLLYLFIFAPLLLGVFFPEVDRYLGEDIYLWILIIVILILSLGINYIQWQAWHNRWREFAAKMGLQFQSYKSKQAFIFQWPRIDGTYKGYSLQIERFTKGSGRYKKIYTSIVMNFREPVSGSLTIIPKRLSSGLRRSLGRGNADLEFVELGDELFDRKVEVKASSSQFARQVLSSHHIQQGLLEIRGQTRDLRIQAQGTELYYQERSNIMDMDYLTDVIITLAELMGYIERSGG
jgi:hypothetical protein